MSSSSPLITCSILCYNYGRFLSQAIDSCLNQTVSKELFEVLVVDDGSTDNTAEVCASYGNRIRVSRTENRGFSRSLARGMEEANGVYVAYLDADDWWEPGKLEQLLPHLNCGAITVIHPMKVVDQNGEWTGKIGACGNTSSCCIRRDAGLSLLPATSEIFCRPPLDMGLGVELSAALADYRIHDAAMTDRSATSKHTEFFARTWHITADRLFMLSATPPDWSGGSTSLRKVARWYKAQAKTKDFERLTEIRDSFKYASSGIGMLVAWARARKLPNGHVARVLMRALLQTAGLK